MKMNHLHRVMAVLLICALAFALAACAPEREQAASAVTEVSGEPLATLFFKYSAASAQWLDYFEDYVPEDAETLIELKLTVQNTTDAPQTMYDSDFILRWAEDDFAWMRDAMTEEMYPAQFVLEAGESATYSVLFTVPKAEKLFTLEYTEQFSADGVETQTGATYQIKIVPE